MGRFAGENLECVRGERPVFAGLDFSMEEGDALVLVGANGSGKTSLLRLMAGLLTPAGGRLLWDGQAIATDMRAHAGRLRFVGHADALKPGLTAAENLSFWAAFDGGGIDIKARVEAALDAFGIGRLADVPGRYLSAGQRRRLALCRLLVTSASLWLLDEPRTALDRDAVGRLDRVLAEHRTTGGLAVLAIHGSELPPAPRLLDLGRLPVGPC
ncbi:MAG: heme ABC exporter ATP-binding protein CcmA [Rhodospirillales bacterium]